MRLGHRPQEPRDRTPVDVVPAPLPLRLQHVRLAPRRVERDGPRLEPRFRLVERVDVRERARQLRDGRRVAAGEEAAQHRRVRRRLRRREHLLYLLGPRDLRQHRRALDRGRPLQVVPRLPRRPVRVVARAVARPHVDDGDLERAGRKLRGLVEELPARAVRDARVLQDLGVGQPEYGDRGVLLGFLQLVLEVALVEYVPLAPLY